MHIMKILKERRGTESIFKAIVVENFPNRGRNKYPALKGLTEFKQVEPDQGYIEA